MKIVFVSYLRVLHSVFPTGEKNHCHICKWKAHIVSLSLTHTHTLKYWIWFILAKCEICNMPHLRASPAEPGWGDCPWGNISFSLTQSSIALWFLLTNSFLPFGAVHPFKEREVWGLLGSVTTSICLKMGRHHLDSGKKKKESYKFCRSRVVQSSKPTHSIQELPWQRQFSKSDSGAKPLTWAPWCLI